jgi:hypothetical protein
MFTVGFNPTGRSGEYVQHIAAVQSSAFFNMIESANGAAAAQGQLKGDVAALESLNSDRSRFNELVMAVAKDATGKDRGRTPREWREALAAENKYHRDPARNPSKRTVDELVPLTYTPSFGSLTFVNKITRDL